ncbi:MAG TPA: hypothetical protein VK563_20530 [Puia sp.]|nr:hypothetical protein [Puia sp.]
MTKYPDSFNDRTDDLDLFSLLLKGMFYSKKYGKLIIATSLVGIFCGVVIYSALPKTYSSKLVLETTVLTNTEEIELINNWDDLLNKDGYGTLARNFNCSPYTLTKLRSIRAEPIQKTGTPDNVSGFSIDIVIKDTSLLIEVQNAIVYGLANNDYVKERVAVRRKNFQDLVDNVRAEMVKLDSIKSSVGDIIQNKKKNNSSLMVDVSGISNQMVLLREKLLNYQEQLQFVDAVRVLQDFVKSGRPKQPRLSVLLAVGLGVGLFLGCGLALYRIVKAKYISTLKDAGQSGS